MLRPLWHPRHGRQADSMWWLSWWWLTSFTPLLLTPSEEYRALLRRKRECFWEAKIQAEKSKPGQLRRSTDALLGRGKTPLPADIDAAQFHRFFDDNTAGVRSTSNARVRLFRRMLPLRHSVISSRWLLMMSLQRFVDCLTKPVHSTRSRQHTLKPSSV